MPQPLAIAIIGAGPAGLTAANILQRHGWRVDIFEADAAAGARDQGGSLDLHPGEGQLALRKAGLLDAFMAVARHEDQEQRLADHATGELLREDIPEPGAGDRPEIDRLALRELLLRPLAPQTVRWGNRLQAVAARPDGRYDLHCHAGLAGPYDLVVGADGAWSRVRAALTPVQPAYTGVTFIELWLTDVDRRHPDIARRAGHGTLFALHGGVGIVAQRNGNATLRVYAAVRTRPEESDRPDLTLTNITQGELLSRFPGWAPSLLAFIAKADRIAAVRPIVALPPGERWTHRAGLTLAGDAAHVMPPLGVGVNLAMLDAAELAEALIEGTDWRTAQRDYETRMLDRAADIAAQCAVAFDDMFEAGGGRALQAQMDAHARPEGA